MKRMLSFPQHLTNDLKKYVLLPITEQKNY